MTLKNAVTEYLAVLDSGSYSSKRLANALADIREALDEKPAPKKPAKKPAAKKSAAKKGGGRK